MRNKLYYPENWVDEIRPSILKRDGFKCTTCGVKHRAYVLVDNAGNYSLIEKDEYVEYLKYGAKTYRIYLNVAHINHNKSDNREENLRSMCPKCHHKHDARHKAVIRIAKLATNDLRKDYPDPRTPMMF